MKKILLHRLKPEEQDEIFRIVIGDILRALFNEKKACVDRHHYAVGCKLQCEDAVPNGIIMQKPVNHTNCY